MVLSAAAAAWLASTVGSDAYTRAIDRARSPSEAKSLRKLVEQQMGGRIPRSRFKSWYEEDATWTNFAVRTVDSYEALRTSLGDALWNPPPIGRRGLTADDQARYTDQLLEATLRSFMKNLPAATAVAVADSRAQGRHEELKRAIIGSDSLDARLLALPPGVRDALQGLQPDYPVEVGRLLEFVETESGHAGSSLAALIEYPVPWFEELPAMGFVALAEFAFVHEQLGVAATLYERAAATGVERSRNLALAALLASADSDDDRAQALVERAASLPGGQDVLVRCVTAAIAQDMGTLLDNLDAARSGDDPRVIALVANALALSGRIDEGLDLLRASTAIEPGRAGHQVAAAQLLVQRVFLRRSQSRLADLKDAESRAITARDARRGWGASSAGAVAVACHAAFLSHDLPRVLQLGLSAPWGEATDAEALDPQVARVTVRALLALAEPERAAALAQATADDFLVAMVAARSCFGDDTIPRDEVCRRVDEAWALARADEDRLDIQAVAAVLGIDPLPGGSELAVDDEMTNLLLAQSQAAVGSVDDAIARLRAWAPRSEQCAVVLADLYDQQDKVDLALDELRTAADRFHRPDLLLIGASMALRRGLIETAQSVTSDCLAVMGSGDPARRDALRIMLGIAQAAGDWHEVERYARALIAELGPVDDYRWMLVGAIYNQGRHEEAWRALTVDGPLIPDDPSSASLWAMLASRYAPSAETTLEAARLLDRFIDNEQCASTIAQALLGLSLTDDPTADVQLTWSAAIAQFVERYPDNPGIRQIPVGENASELLELLEATLGESNGLVEDLQRQVARSEAPYGVLAAAGGRPYVTTLLQCSAGVLPIHAGEPAQAEMDRADAAAAMDGVVVVDPSVLVIGTLAEGLWEVEASAFSGLILTDEALRDIIASKEFLGRGDGTSVSLDPSGGGVVLHETAPEVLSGLRERAALVESRARALRLTSWPTQRGISLAPDDERRFDGDPRMWSWASGLDMAKARELPFMTDDVALRSLARSEGVPTFGSAALVEVLRERGTVDDAARDYFLRQWRLNFCVDLPGCDALLALARERGFDPNPAAVMMSRPAFWQDGAGALGCFDSICDEAAATAPDHLPDWLYAAIVGVTGDHQVGVAPRKAVGLLLRMVERVGPSPARFARMVHAAREALRRNGAELAIIEVFRPLAASLQGLDPDTGMRYLLGLAGELSDEDRRVARAVAFGADGSA